MTFRLLFNLKYTYHFLVLPSFLTEVLDSKFESSKWREREKKYFSSFPLLEATAKNNFLDFFLLLMLKASILPIFYSY